MRGLTAKQFRYWEMYDEIEPFSDRRDDYRIASVCQMLYNVNRGKNQKPLPLKDFLLKFDAAEEKPRGQSVQEKLNVMTVIMRAWAEANAENNANAAAAKAVADAHGVTIS